MKVFFIINEFGNGGRERRLVQLIRALDKVEGIQMMAAITRDEIEYHDVEETSVNIVVMKNGPLRYKINELEQQIRNFQPDIIHLWVETAMFCVFVPIFSHKYHCKYIAGFVADGNSFSRLPIYQRLSIRFTFWMADAIVSNSKAGLEAKGAPLKKSRIIYNGFDQDRLAKVNVVSKRNALGVHTDFLVTMCGRMESAKDWDSFISLAIRSGKERKNIMFLAVVGRGEMLNHYLELVRTKNVNNIKFLSCRNDVMEIFAASDVSVLFTNSDVHAEGVSNSIMESMASGVPVIATAGGGTAEIIEDEQNGYIIEPKNVEMAYKRLILLLDNKEKRIIMGEHAKMTVQNKFNLSSMAGQYLSLYNELLS